MNEANKDINEIKRKIILHRASIITIVVAVLIVAVIVFLVVYFYNKNKTYTTYTVEDEMDMDNEIDAMFYEYGNLLLKSSPDGITYYEMGKQIWNKSFDIKNPVFDICGDYTAVAQRNTNTIYIFNKEGIQATVTSQNPVKKLRVSSKGIVAVVSEDDTANYVEIIDKKSNSIALNRTVLSGDGYPIDADISFDSEKLIVSYIYLSEGEPRTRVAFYNLTEVGQNEIDNLVGGYNYKSTIVGDVEFINETTAVAIGDNKFTIYTITQKPTLVATIEIADTIKTVFYNENNIGIITESTNKDNPYTLTVYDLDGDIVLAQSIAINYTKAKFDKENVLLYNDAKCLLISFKGIEKFEYSFDEGIRDILVTQNDFEYIFITSNRVEKVALD